MNEHLLKSGLDSVAPTSGALNASVVVALLRQPDGFCRTEEAGPDCMKAVKSAFRETLDELSRRYGNDVSAWRWGSEHIALMENQVLDNVPGFRALLGQSFPSDGGFYSVNRGGSLGVPGKAHPLVRGSGAGFRGIYDWRTRRARASSSRRGRAGIRCRRSMPINCRSIAKARASGSTSARMS